jgi:hypothetical protein
VSPADDFNAADGVQTGCQPKLPVGVQQIDPPDLLQVQPDRVFTQLHYQAGVIQNFKWLFLHQAFQLGFFLGQDAVIGFLYQ